MASLADIITIAWFLRTIKVVLFWIYLWQLKEYHIWRFKDHFSTHKGKRLLFNYVLLVKLALVPLMAWQTMFIWALLGVYLAETAIFGAQIAKKRVKMPVPTFKAILLVAITTLVVTVYGFWTYQYHWPALALLMVDILMPVTVSLVVLCVQPFFVIARTRILRKARQKIRQFPNLKVIAITGSYGKTATKEFLATILASKYRVLATPKHKNSEMGIAQTILQDLQSNHEIFIVEMGAYAKGGIKLLCDMTGPSMGIVTGVNQQHLSTFGSLNNLLSAEGGRELVESLPQNGLVVLNADNQYCLDLYKNIYKYRKGGLKKRAYTVKKEKIDSDIWTEDVVVSQRNVSFLAVSKDKEMTPINVKVLGRQQVQNLLAAILVARELGLSMEQIQQACAHISPEQAGMVVKTGINGINIIDSSYSSNPDGVMADLDYLAQFPQKKIVIMPCLIELGSASAAIHKNIGYAIGKSCDMAIITSKDRFQELKKGMRDAGMEASNIIFSEKPAEILGQVKQFCKKGDAVLLEGRIPGGLIELLH